MLAVARSCHSRSILPPSLVTETSPPAQAKADDTQQLETISTFTTTKNLPRRAAAGGAANQRAFNAAVSTATDGSSTEDAPAAGSPTATNEMISQVSTEKVNAKRLGHPVPAAGHPAAAGTCNQDCPANAYSAFTTHHQ